MKKLLSGKHRDLRGFKSACEANGLPFIDFVAWRGEASRLQSEIQDIERVRAELEVSVSKADVDWRRYSPPSALKRWIDGGMLRDLRESTTALDGDGNLKLVVCGLLKAGKSTFLNCVTGHCDNELFRTDDVRATIRNQSFVKDGVEYIDTPGIDAEGCDEKEALDALRTADCVVFAHNLADGELTAEERVFLEKVAATFGTEGGFPGKCLLLLTRLDKKSAKDAARVEEKAQKQIREIFGAEMNSAAVSSTRYIKGTLENKNLLVERSGYGECLQSLGRKIDFCRRDAVRERSARLRMCVEKITKALGERIGERRVAAAENRRRLNAALSGANALIVDRCAAYLSEIENA